MGRTKSDIEAARTVRQTTKSAAYTEEVARHFAWIDWVQSRTGLGDTSLAEQAGLEKNYLYRKRNVSPLNPAKIRQIVDFTGLPGPDTYLLPGIVGLSEEATRFDDAAADVDPAIADVVRHLIKDRPNAAAWTLNTRALEGAGYLPGDIVITDAKALPFSGEAVCAQVADAKAGTAETIFRILERPYLVAASSDPALRKPLLIDDDRVIVVATVVQSFRPRRRP